MWLPTRPDQIVSPNYFFYFCLHKIVKGIQMLLNQSPNLPKAKVSTGYPNSTTSSYIYLITCNSNAYIKLLTLRNSGRSWNLSTADFTGAVRILWSKPESPGTLLPPLLLCSQKPALTLIRERLKIKKKKYTLSTKQ